MGTGGDRSLLYISGGIVAIVVLTIVVVLVAAPAARPSLVAGSAEEVLQRYLESDEAGDWAAAYALFSSRVHERMTFEAYELAADRHWPQGEGPTRSVTFDHTSGEGDRAVVHLTVEEFYGEGLDASSYSHPRQVRMVREGGEWRIDEALVGLDTAPVEVKP